MTPEQFEVLIRVDANVQALKEHRKDHETRLRSLEKTKHWSLGFAAAVSAIVNLFWPR